VVSNPRNDVWVHPAAKSQSRGYNECVVSITADQERQFYDSQYTQFLRLPDADLACNRRTIEADLANPAHPVYERRKLYLAILRILLAEPAAGISVLDYGCGTGDWGLLLAGEGARVASLDLSEAAIQVVLRRAAASGVEDRVRGFARDASDLSCFRDAEFDLIYASAAVHHTLKYPNALRELMRVLRPGGKLVLAETFGNNKLLNAARRWRWQWSGQPDEAGEEIILDDRHLDLLRGQLHRLDVIPVNLLAMAKRLFRGRFQNGGVRATVRALEAMDTVLLRAAPGLRRYCGEVVVVGEK
jgi:SAM-dependent methyltransferase